MAKRMIFGHGFGLLVDGYTLVPTEEFDDSTLQEGSGGTETTSGMASREALAAGMTLMSEPSGGTLESSADGFEAEFAALSSDDGTAGGTATYTAAATTDPSPEETLERTGFTRKSAKSRDKKLRDDTADGTGEDTGDTPVADGGTDGGTATGTEPEPDSVPDSETASDTGETGGPSGDPAGTGSGPAAGGDTTDPDTEPDTGSETGGDPVVVAEGTGPETGEDVPETGSPQQAPDAPADPGSGPVISVSSATGLMAALDGAEGGETILLEPGDYGALSIRLAFGQPVTIASADPSDPAVITGLGLRGAANLVFDGLLFDYDAAPGAPLHDTPYRIEASSRDIVIRNSVFDGDRAEGLTDVDNGYATGKGLFVQDSSGITVEGNEFYDWHRGMTFGQTSDIAVIGNDIHSIRSDGLNFAEVTGALIEDNWIHDFEASLGSADHRDMIQIWTNGTDAPSTGVTIRGNTLTAGDGDYTQSIFMRNDQVDRGLAGDEMFYRDFLIEDNLIWNAHTHGITVGETDGLVIRNNTILQNAAAIDGGSQFAADHSIWVPKINVTTASLNVDISDNIAAAWPGTVSWGDQPPAAWSIAGNILIEPEQYGSYFVNPYDVTSLDDLRLTQPLDGAGAPVSQPLDGGQIGSSTFADLGDAWL